MPVASPAAPVNRNDENVDESVSVVSSASGITSCRASKLHGVATWCAALQHGAPCCNSVALRSAGLTRLGGCKLRHVAFECGYIAPCCNILCCTMTLWHSMSTQRGGGTRAHRLQCVVVDVAHVRLVELDAAWRRSRAAGTCSTLKKHSMLRRVATAMPTAAIRPTPTPGESRAGRVLGARI
jgi:hypothetical protein